MCKHFSWSELYQHRRSAAKRFGSIFQLPLVTRLRDVLSEYISGDARVLEVGAGERKFGAWLREAHPNARYASMDIDERGEHDFRSLDEVRGTYRCVFAFEVVEHLTLSEIVPWLARLASLLEPGGHLVLSTPNTFYPPAYLRDATHCTPLCYDELAALAALAGLHVERIARVYHDPLHRILLRRYAFGWLFRLIGIDFARQIVLVARAAQ